MSQDRKFVAMVVENLPDVSEDIKQGWIENPMGLRKALREALLPPNRWEEKDGVIYFSVTSNGITNEQWIAHLEKRGFRLSDYAKSVLRSPDFKPTNGVTTKVAVIRGSVFPDIDRVTSKIRAEAGERKLAKPNAEVACLIRDMFSDEELEAMGLWWIVVFHEPINDSDGNPRLLAADRDADGHWLDAYCGKPGYRWSHDIGFAFAVSQVSSS